MVEFVFIKEELLPDKQDKQRREVLAAAIRRTDKDDIVRVVVAKIIFLSLQCRMNMLLLIDLSNVGLQDLPSLSCTVASSMQCRICK
mmetsp:Transcript_67/g.139  ORF Transcript_67/g.139 Transcript_67/m.139 type:complete len:87 (+) Transcript_67:869-1129(+)